MSFGDWWAPARLSNDRGVSIVEFALLCPLVIGLIFATIEFANVWRVQNELQAVAREAVRRVATGALANDMVEAFVKGHLPEAASDSVTISIEEEELANDRTDVEINLSVQLSAIMVLGDWFFSEGDPEDGAGYLTASATMLKE